MTRRCTNARVKTAAGWIWWHTGELAALAVPVALAVTVTGWAWLLAALVAAGWVAHEAHIQTRSRRHRTAASALTSPRGNPPQLDPTTDKTGKTGETRQEASHG